MREVAMEAAVEYPDAELAQSPIHGAVFRVPKLEIPDDSSEDDGDYRRRSYVRPHSAKGPNLDLPSRVLPSKTKGVRPWSAMPKGSKPSSANQRKISRQPLRKPHFRPPPRSPTVSISSEASSLITAVGLANNVKKVPDSPDSTDAKTKPANGQSFSERWAITLSEAVPEKDEQEEREPEENQEPVKRTNKKHPTFESWIAGSPHNSDEYDTDLDIEDFVKTQIKEEKPIDPTGKAMYADQCKVQGSVPVSYIHRHLGEKNLRMRHHYLGGNGTKPIAVALVSNTITETLDIKDNFLEAEGARYIAGMLKDNTFITSLNISSNFIGRAGIEAVARMLESNTTLKTLSVSENKLTDSCAKCLIEGLKNNTSLTSLDLSSNDFGELGGMYIGGAISVNEGLIDLDISWNAVRNKGASAIITALQRNRTLEVLDLSWNGIGQAGAEALKTVLKGNTTLKVLDITNNRLNTSCAESIAWGLTRNTGLESLVMNLNPIKDAGVESILKAVEKHPHLKLLSIEEIGISRGNYKKIRELETSRDIMILHGGVGGYTRVTTATSMINLFSAFVRHHAVDLETSCHQYDQDRNCLLGLEDLKMALKEGGLRLTNRQLNIVIDELNFTNSSTMNYRDILNGRTLEEYYKHRPSRAMAIKSRQLNINSLPDTIHRQLTVA